MFFGLTAAAGLFRNAALTGIGEALRKAGEDSPAAARQAGGTSKAVTKDLGVAQSARDIMQRYDFTNISYTDLKSAAKELVQAGALPEKDYLDFIGPSSEYANLDGSRNANWNEAKNVLGDRRQQLDFMKSSGSESRFIAFQSYMVGLFDKFQSLRQA